MAECPHPFAGQALLVPDNPALPAGVVHQNGSTVEVTLTFPEAMDIDPIVLANNFIYEDPGTGVGLNMTGRTWLNNTTLRLTLTNPDAGDDPATLDYFIAGTRLATADGYEYPAWTNMSLTRV